MMTAAMSRPRRSWSHMAAGRRRSDPRPRRHAAMTNRKHGGNSASLRSRRSAAVGGRETGGTDGFREHRVGAGFGRTGAVHDARVGLLLRGDGSTAQRLEHADDELLLPADGANRVVRGWLHA